MENLVVMIKEAFKKACLPMLEYVGDRPKQGLARNDMEGVQKMLTLDYENITFRHHLMSLVTLWRIVLERQPKR